VGSATLSSPVFDNKVSNARVFWRRPAISRWSVLRYRNLRLLKNTLTASKQTRNFLHSHCCLLLVRNNFLKHLVARFSVSKTLRQVPHGALLALRFMFLGFFRGVLLLNFDKIVERELLIVGFLQLEYTLNIAGTNLSAYLNILRPAENDLSEERRK